jgi:hypothetical protein
MNVEKLTVCERSLREEIGRVRTQHADFLVGQIAQRDKLSKIDLYLTRAADLIHQAIDVEQKV